MHRAAAFALAVITLSMTMGLPPSAPAQAGAVIVYKCRTAQGGLIYQGTPCPHGQQQQTMQLDDREPASLPPPPASSASPPRVATATPVPPPPPLPRTPPSTMYRCTRATDQTTYLSSNGNPQPYYAPLAMTGMLPTSLGPVMPGVKPNAAMVASQYVLMQDQCAPMSSHDTCATLRDQYDETERKLSRAFKSDQPPLRQREKELLAQLSHC